MAAARAVLLAVVAAVLLASAAVLAPAAGADEGLYMTWKDCARNGVGKSNLSVLCIPDAPPYRLVCAFTLSVPVDQVIGVEAVVDYQVADSLVPQWWRYGPGDCRQGSLTASENFTADTTCLDPWHNTGVAVIQDYEITQPRGGVNQARIQAVAAVPSGDAAALAAGPMTYAIALLIDNVGTQLCGGCTDAVCLVLNSIWLRRLPGAPGGDVLLQTPGPGSANWATWQGDGTADCQAVPVRRTTWGRVKSLYR